MRKKPQQRRHWYRITSYCCVLCGRTTEYRERVYGRKPKDPRRTHEFNEDACADHFL